MTTDHSLLSSYREMLLEHLFAGAIMRHLWLSGTRRLEILKPQVDDGGYDLVLEAASIVRHVQLKATFRGSKVRRFNINTRLADKPSGCVVVLLFDSTNLDFGPFLWFGGEPGRPLPNLGHRIGRHTKGNAKGIKSSRPSIRVLSRSSFKTIHSIAVLSKLMFGQLAMKRSD
jgi:hypothetical protein